MQAKLVLPMKTPSILAIALTMIGLSINVAFAQTAGVGETASLQAKFEERVKLDVLRPHGLAVADLNAKFISALERAQEAAQKSGKLEEAVAIKTEKEAVLAGNYTPAEDGAGTPAGVKTLRNTYRTALAKLELDRDKKLQPLKAAFSKGLEGVIDTLTKNGKLDEAISAKKLRDELLASIGSVTSSGSGKESSGATDGKTFVNSLGMKFVSVPGTKTLMCIHETRRQDYAAYAAALPGVDSSWQNQQYEGVPCGHEDVHPVVGVSWEDAQGFCSWLRKKEGKTYRLPSDREWSIAVGLGSSETTAKDSSPESFNMKIRDEFPWGGIYPPTSSIKAGNYADLAWNAKFPSSTFIAGYSDGFATTSPVMSFKANKHGIHDLGGNVFEWVDDWFNSTQSERVLRGGGFTNRVSNAMLSSFRDHRQPSSRDRSNGFRCVVETGP